MRVWLMMRIMLPPDGMVMPHIMYEVVASVLIRNTRCEVEGQTEDQQPEMHFRLRKWLQNQRT